MIELPEAIVIAGQINGTVGGKRILSALANHSPHKFAWYTGNPAEYNQRFAGKTINLATGTAMFVEIYADEMKLVVYAPLRYYFRDEKRPAKHQLLVEFENGTAISSTVRMWGGFFCFPEGGKSGFADYEIATGRPSPLSDDFNRAYFDGLISEKTAGLSAKAFLATEQRIPGLGNGVLQDILWKARIHPKRKMRELSPSEIDKMFNAVKSMLKQMTAQGGRDTERDLFSEWGGYKTVLSKNTANTPCPACGAIIQKENYMGGSIYYCGGCQPL